MNNRPPTQPEPASGINVGDIYYVLFRHKWKIILLSLAGLLAAAAFYFLKPPPYESQAELLIKYVPQAGTLPVLGSDQKVVVPDSRGFDIINSEIQIMSSMDLAEQAATNIGAAAILAKVGGGSNALAAAAYILRNFEAAPAGQGGGKGGGGAGIGSSSVIVVSFKHPDPEIVQPVLHELLNDYLQKQREIHSAGGQFTEALEKEVATLGLQLNDTEQQLANLKNKANTTSLDDTRKDLADQAAKIQNAVWDAEAELAGYEEAMKQAGVAPAEAPAPATNAPPAVPQDQIDAYNSISASLDALHKKEQGYILQGFTSSNALVRDMDGQIASQQTARDELQKKYPQITSLGTTSPTSAGQPARPVVDHQMQIAQVAALKAKLKAWDSQLVQIQMQATNLNNIAPSIAQLEQMKMIQEANYQNLSTGIEKSHIDQALDNGNTAPNINWVQQPSPPFQDWKKTYKTLGMLAFGGIAAGFALAFLIEFVLDRSIRRPAEVVSKLKMLLFLSIPDLSRNGHVRLAGTAERRQLPLSAAAESNGTAAPAGGGVAVAQTNGSVQVVSLERNPALHPFCEALRDRLIVYFEVRNLTHKPKLVAVTSANRGAGVSSIAAGLAASLSETGDGNVLLVDMNLEQGAAQQFYKGKAGCGLDTALQPETKADALVQENLYVVNGNANSAELPRILPKRFAALVPRLKASEYDYIIFDMPPVSQTSLTSRLARFMDMVLLVVESEKSDREVVQQANNWLAESGATVGAVLNKTRQYTPKRLHQEFLDEK